MEDLEHQLAQLTFLTSIIISFPTNTEAYSEILGWSKCDTTLTTYAIPLLDELSCLKQTTHYVIYSM